MTTVFSLTKTYTLELATPTERCTARPGREAKCYRYAAIAVIVDTIVLTGAHRTNRPAFCLYHIPMRYQRWFTRVLKPALTYHELAGRAVAHNRLLYSYEQALMDSCEEEMRLTNPIFYDTILAGIRARYQKLLNYHKVIGGSR